MQRFTVQDLGVLSASKIVDSFENGEIDGERMVFLKPDCPPKPLRKLIRELVFMAFREHSASTDPESPQEAEAEAEARGKHELYKLAFEQAPNGIFLTDLAARIIETNQSFAEFLGYEHPSELIGKTIGSITDPAMDRSEERQQCNDVLTGKRPTISTEHIWLRKDGSQRESHVSVSLTRTPEGLPSDWVTHTIDLSEQKKIAETLARNDRHASLGRMAGRVAHDFNNLLLIIQASLSHLCEDGRSFLFANPEIEESINAAQQAGEMAARLTMQLMAFNKTGVVSTQVIDLHDQVRKMSKMLQRSLPAEVRLVLEPTPEHSETSKIRMNVVLLEQTVVNLVTNSKKAFTKGQTGVIRIRCLVDKGSDDASEGLWVGFEVSDNGCGMPKEVLDKAFEPFFSTRGVGSNGLGLATVHGVITRFQGRLHMDSEVGKGTCCRVFFPALEGADKLEHACEPPPFLAIEWPPTPAARQATPDLISTKRPYRVLIIDDQPPILRIVEMVLQRAGYLTMKTDTVQGATSALRSVRDGTDPRGWTTLDLIISDMLMSDGTGTDVEAVAKSMWPELPVTFMTGYSADLMEQHGALAGKSFLSKPFTPDQLLAHVSQLLKPAAAPRLPRDGGAKRPHEGSTGGTHKRARPPPLQL